jgi:hypothetical protein
MTSERKIPDRSKMTRDELIKLDEVLTTAKRWLREGFQVNHAMATLDYWGEPYDKPEGRK